MVCLDFELVQRETKRTPPPSTQKKKSFPLFGAIRSQTKPKEHCVPQGLTARRVCSVFSGAVSSGAISAACCNPDLTYKPYVTCPLLFRPLGASDCGAGVHGGAESSEEYYSTISIHDQGGNQFMRTKCLFPTTMSPSKKIDTRVTFPLAESFCAKRLFWFTPVSISNFMGLQGLWGGLNLRLCPGLFKDSPPFHGPPGSCWMQPSGMREPPRGRGRLRLGYGSTEGPGGLGKQQAAPAEVKNEEVETGSNQ